MGVKKNDERKYIKIYRREKEEREKESLESE